MSSVGGTGTRGRNPENRFKYAFGVCMDAVTRYRARCVCNRGNGNDSTPTSGADASHVTVQCAGSHQSPTNSNSNTTTTLEETVKDGLIVLQVICDQYHHNSSQTVCIQEHFGITDDGFGLESCHIQLNGYDCQGCYKVPGACHHDPLFEDVIMDGFIMQCGNVHHLVGNYDTAAPPPPESETLCFHAVHGVFALYEEPLTTTTMATQIATTVPAAAAAGHDEDTSYSEDSLASDQQNNNKPFQYEEDSNNNSSSSLWSDMPLWSWILACVLLLGVAAGLVLLRSHGRRRRCEQEFQNHKQQMHEPSLTRYMDDKDHDVYHDEPLTSNAIAG